MTSVHKFDWIFGDDDDDGKLGVWFVFRRGGARAVKSRSSEEEWEEKLLEDELDDEEIDEF